MDLPEVKNTILGLNYPDYMRSPTPDYFERSPTPDYSEDDSLQSTWFADTPEIGSSSPLGSCLQSWLHNELTEELDICADLPPLSSSPDFKTSSPHSSGSKKSESETTSSSLTSYSSDDSESQQNEPVDDLQFAGRVDDFEQRLHQLLLNALKEREESGSFRRQFSGSYSITPEISFSQQTDSPEDDTRLAKRCRSATPDVASENQLDSDEISPIRFENGTKTPRISTFRIIKRAQSYQASIAGNLSNKRQKTSRNSGAHAHEQVYASRAASLRRGESLKSLADVKKRAPLTSIVECPPTVPNSPANAVIKAIPNPVPIIAPPSNHTAGLPMSNETVAKARLFALLERESIGREEDGLFPGISERPPLRMTRESNDIYEEETLEDSIKHDWEAVMGIGGGKRKAIIDWFLTILPARQEKQKMAAVLSSTPSPCCSSSGYSSQSTTSTSSNQSEITEPDSNLYDQLRNSPETRFHAAWLFLRFFFLTMQPGGPLDDANSHISKTLQKEGFNLIIWDIAVACLSLSVKFHRDFLEPLSPVYAQEYLSLTAHGMCRDDLESAHRDILSAIDYKLGITPQPVMQQLWLTLPSLRELLDFEDAWGKVVAGTWALLFQCLRQPDVQRFPISMLTVVCSWNAIVNALGNEHCQEIDAREPGAEEMETGLGTGSLSCNVVSRAVQQSEGVLCDIQALVGVTDV